MSAYTTNDLLVAIRDYVTLPEFDEGSDARLVRLLNREQSGYIQKLLQAARSEYRTAIHEITLVSGQLAYDIPTRAIASGVNMIQAVDASGNQWLMVEVRPSDVPNRLGPVWVAPGRQFYLQRNQIIFYAAPPTGTLRITYPLRLSEMVLVSQATTITAKSATTVTLQATMSSGAYDFIQSAPQFDTLAMDQTVTVSGTTGTLTAVPDRVAVGCYMSLAGTTPVCQAPLELHPLLCCRVAYVSIQAKGDPAAERVLGQLNQMERDVTTLLEPRPAKPRSNVNYSGPGWRNGWSGGWRGIP